MSTCTERLSTQPPADQQDEQRYEERELNGKGAGADDLRKLFRRHAAGVAVITALYHGRPVGLLVTSLASVSASPPTVSFNVSVSSSSWPALQAQPMIGLHILDAGQQEVAELFARKGADRFAAPTSWQVGPYGVPLLEGTVGWSVARIEQRVPVADHVIVVARLLHTGTDDARSPLLHHDGDWHQVQARHQVGHHVPASQFGPEAQRPGPEVFR